MYNVPLVLFEEKVMSLNLLTIPEFHVDLVRALETVTNDDLRKLNEKIINEKELEIPDKFIDLVRESDLFKKLLVLSERAFASNDSQVANGMMKFFIEMAERRLKHQQ